jgi:hypothetical protein
MKPNAAAAALLLTVLLGSCDFAVGPGETAKRGWELTDQNTGLSGVGIDRLSLGIYAGPAKPESGTVISLKRIDTTLDLSAGGIVIDRCWIRPLSVSRGNQLIVTYDNDNATAPAPAAVTLQDCDIDGSALSDYDVCFSTGFAGNGTVRRCNIQGCGSGIAILHAGSSIPALIEGNYIHNLRSWGDPATTGSHTDGFTVRDYAGPSLTVRNNRIDCSAGNDTGAFFIQPYSGPVDRLLAEGNLLEGYGYQLILQRHNFDYGTSMRAVNNRFAGTGYGPGYVDRGGLAYGWSEWRANYLNDPSRADNMGTPVAVE